MKKAIYNKIRYSLLGMAGLLALTSCEDFLTITPTDKTVLEDFWKSKDDVDEMVTGAYKYLASGDVVNRSIYWGEFRSGNLKKHASYVNTDLENILAGKILPTFGVNGWAPFYKVINTCNVILDHAPGVLEIDPAFTEGDYQTVKGQMLALRALCHFYLIRAFRDIPYVTRAYENTDDMTVGAQLPPDSTLQYCINDLLEARPYCYKYGTFGETDWRNMGYITTDVVDAILADVYLWRASMTGNMEDYQNVVAYTQNVIDSHKHFYESYNNAAADANNPYHLYQWKSMQMAQTPMYAIFTTGNSRESIFELQFDGSSNANSELRTLYYRVPNGSSFYSYPSLVGTSSASRCVAQNPRTSSAAVDFLFRSTGDYRAHNYAFSATSSTLDSYEIRKFVSNSTTVNSGDNKSDESSTSRDPKNYKQNWILYRITDIMLMQAEARIQLASDDEDDTNLQQAFGLIKAVNDRSVCTTTSVQENDSLKFNNYKAKSTMELLCLQERGRELLFEGKRWFDLVRHSYRHMTGVDITKTLYEIDPTGSDNGYPSLSESNNSLTGIMANASSSTIKAKMKNEAYLYWPVLRSEIDKNPLLHQNPVWVETQSTERQ